MRMQNHHLLPHFLLDLMLNFGDGKLQLIARTNSTFKIYLPYYLGYKAMALYPIQGHLAFWKIDLSVIYKAMALYPL